MMTEQGGPTILFGGTFDPPHRGHVELPLRAADLIGSNRVIYMPANVNPQKSSSPPIDPVHRRGMLEVALEELGDPRAMISTIELDRTEPSYSILTVRQLLEEMPPEQGPLRLLVGTDQALNFTTWKCWEEIERLAEPLVLPRAPWNREALHEAFERMQPGRGDLWMTRVLDIPEIMACSTDARNATARQESIEQIVPPSVEAYIQRHGLYA